MQFVNFTQIMSRPIPTSKKEAEFALSALMEIPEQFKAAMSLQLLGYFSCQNHTNFWNFWILFFFSFLVALIQLIYIWFLGQQTKGISKPTSVASACERSPTILWMFSSQTYPIY